MKHLSLPLSVILVIGGFVTPAQACGCLPAAIGGSSTDIARTRVTTMPHWSKRTLVNQMRMMRRTIRTNVKGF